MGDEREKRSEAGAHGSGHRQQTSSASSAEGRNKASGGKESERVRGRAEKSGRPAVRSRSSDSDRRGREGRGREREGSGGAEKRERGWSAEGRKGKREGELVDQQGQEDDTECVVCFCTYDNTFKAPKVLACGHTFCLECLARINVLSLELKSLSCPVCRELTDLPHGRNLPQLDNNQDIFRKLPPEMQRALSVRFNRSKGRLVLKKPSAGTTGLILPGFRKKEQEGQRSREADLYLGSLEQGHAQATTVDVGRPPSRVRGRLRQIIRSNQCYYAVVAAIIMVTVALMLVGILAFVVVPNVMSSGSNKPFPGSNQTASGTEG